MLSQKFEDGGLCPESFILRELLPAELNYDVVDKEMLAFVFLLQKWRHFLHGAQHTTIVYSDHQDLTYFKIAVSLNRRQARWAEELQTFNFDLIYQKGSSNLKADTLSRCLAFTSREGGTTATGNQMLLRLELWLEVGAMQIEEDDIEVMSIGAMDVEQLLPEAKERIREKAMPDEDCRATCKQLKSGGNVHKEYGIHGEILC